MTNLTFVANQALEGGFYAETLEVGIFAEGETVEELKGNIKSGIDCYFDKTGINPRYKLLMKKQLAPNLIVPL